jgi:membrane-associated protease RseP (regulator of RpoE activity)
MRRISIIILGIILLSGCAALRSHQEPEGNFVNVARASTASETINNELVVKSLREGFPAELAGVKRGDIIVSIDGKIFTTEKEFISLMNNKQLGDHVLLVINRNGKQVKFDIEPKMIKTLRTAMKIQNLLLENNKVSIAIIVSEVKNSFPNVSKDWADSMRINLQSGYESFLIFRLGEKNENFSIVDRSRLKQILDEFQFSQSGFVSDKLRAKIGEMTGATHILDVSFSRFQSSSGMDDITSARLVEIESGKVLAVDQVKTH